MTHIMKTNQAFDDLDEKKRTICKWIDQEINKGCENVSCEELGQAIDMLKDLTQAQKDLWESCYYKSVVEAMEKYDDNPRMGYNPNRNAKGQYSDGRSGYYDDNEMYGYTRTRMGNSGRMTRSQSGNNRSGYIDPIYYDRMMGYTEDDEMDRQYGRNFNNFRKAKRHYTETHSEEDKRRMNEHADKHLNQTISTLKEIWADADPDLRMKMKNDLTNLSNEMVV